MYIEQIALIVDDYDDAIGFFVDVLGFELVEDSPALTSPGRTSKTLGGRPPAWRPDRAAARESGRRSGGASRGRSVRGTRRVVSPRRRFPGFV
jgi:catechol 2,3-dioxygenase-like lactoylglutathione lyase family enzyme